MNNDSNMLCEMKDSLIHKIHMTEFEKNYEALFVRLSCHGIMYFIDSVL